jgi:RNA polymerase sigma factor (sigma-70 family)
MTARVSTQTLRPCLRPRQLLQLSTTTRYGSAMTAVPDWDIASPRETDAELVTAVLGGDRSAFAQMYDRYADRLYDFCVGMLRDRDGAADCVQDAFCIAATRLAQLREPDKLRPWLYSIARNEVQRRFRERHRETPSEELPDDTSEEPGPDTLAARTELADLIADAAGGLTDRDQTVLELSYRHGLDGPELAQALGVSQTNANTMVGRLRDTIERSLGALLVARRVQSDPARCAELAAILDGWDGHFNVLMRKRVVRHIESCPTCNDERHRLVSPTALLGATPIFIQAPKGLRQKTIDGVKLVPFEAGVGGAAEAEGGDRRTRRWVLPVLVFAAVVGALFGLTALWPPGGPVGINPTDVTDSVEPPIGSPMQTTANLQTTLAEITTPPHSPGMQTPTVTTTMPDASPPSNPPQVDETTPVTIASVPPRPTTSAAPTESSSRPTLSSRLERTRIEGTLPRSQPTRRAVNPPPNRAPAPDPIR